MKTHSFPLPSIRADGPTAGEAAGAMILSGLVLAGGLGLSPWRRWARTLPSPLRLLMLALNALWGGLFIFLLLPSIYMIGIGAVFLTVELLRLTLAQWEISGVMLIAGAVLFASSRGLAIWRALNTGA